MSTYISNQEFWDDGICKLCGSIVEEGPSNRDFDYMNRCTNKDCINHIWHHCYDVEFLDYYIHKRK